jgi:hypothetical protein
VVPCYGQRIMMVPAPRSADGRTRHIAVNIANAGPAAEGVRLVIAGRRSYSTYPPRLRVSYLIQIPKTIRRNLKNAGRFQAPAAPAPVR